MISDRVTKFLEDIRFLGEERFNLVQALREEVLSLEGSISEEIKYGGILFAVDKPFCGIFSYSKHVSLEFGDGRHSLIDTTFLRAKGSCAVISSSCRKKTS
jgi:hypothetical protein